MNLAEQTMGDEAGLEYMLNRNDFLNGDPWEQQLDAFNELQQAERAALRRVAVGMGTRQDAVLLARSLGHLDLFGEKR